MKNFSYLMAAYSVVWLFLAGYIFYIVLIQKKLEAEIKSLKEIINK